jgi:hypothetical protein
MCVHAQGQLEGESDSVVFIEYTFANYCKYYFNIIHFIHHLQSHMMKHAKDTSTSSTLLSPPSSESGQQTGVVVQSTAATDDSAYGGSPLQVIVNFTCFENSLMIFLNSNL